MFVSVAALSCASPSLLPLTGPVVGMSQNVRVNSDSSCITSLGSDPPDRLSGTLTASTLTLTDQFGTQRTWRGTWRGDVGDFSGGQVYDAFSGPCQLREHYVDQRLTLLRTQTHLQGTAVATYELLSVGGADTGLRGQDTSTYSLDVY